MLNEIQELVFNNMQLTTERRTFIIENYLSTNSYNAVIAAFRIEFSMRQPPHVTTIRRLLQKFHRLGTVQNQNPGNSGRNRTARTPKNIALVQQALAENPRISARRNGIGLSKSTFNEITKIDLCYHPYRMRIRHALENGDRERRINYSNWLIRQFEDENFPSKIVFGDEAAFTMNGEVNSHNVVQYAPKGEAPDFHYDKGNSREKVTVWAAVRGNGTILGPFFLCKHERSDIFKYDK